MASKIIFNDPLTQRTKRGIAISKMAGGDVLVREQWHLVDGAKKQKWVKITNGRLFIIRAHHVLKMEG